MFDEKEVIDLLSSSSYSSSDDDDDHHHHDANDGYHVADSNHGDQGINIIEIDNDLNSSTSTNNHNNDNKSTHYRYAQTQTHTHTHKGSKKRKHSSTHHPNKATSIINDDTLTLTTPPISNHFNLLHVDSESSISFHTSTGYDNGNKIDSRNNYYHGNNSSAANQPTCKSPVCKLYKGDGDNGILTTTGFKSLIQNLHLSFIRPNNNTAATTTATTTTATRQEGNRIHHFENQRISYTNNTKSIIATYLSASTVHGDEDSDDGNQNLKDTTTNTNTNTTHTCVQTTTPCRIIVAHIQQKDNWTCGFRNLQMLLSAILPNVPEHHPIHSFLHSLLVEDTLTNTKTKTKSYSTSSTQKVITIPSIKQLQHFIEQAWQEGFDKQGKKHYNNQMIGKSGHDAKVGAVEISTILSYLFVDSTVIQFIACYESRSLLCHFLWAYFNHRGDKNNNNQGGGYDDANARATARSGSSSSSSSSSSSLDSSYELLQSITKQQKSTSTLSSSSWSTSTSIHQPKTTPSLSTSSPSSSQTNHSCNHFSLPLYLQWEGHSVTCIGIEKVLLPTNNSNNDHCYHHHQQQQQQQNEQCEYNVIIFDPAKKATSIKHHLKQMNTQNHQNDHNHMSTKERRILRISSKELLKKDCQILLCTLNPINDNVRKTRALMINSNVITAAHDDVEKLVLKRRRIGGK